MLNSLWNQIAGAATTATSSSTAAADTNRNAHTSNNSTEQPSSASPLLFFQNIQNQTQRFNPMANGNVGQESSTWSSFSSSSKSTNSHHNSYHNQHKDEDDILAEQLLSTFPPFGTNKKRLEQQLQQLQQQQHQVDIIDDEELLLLQELLENENAATTDNNINSNSNSNSHYHHLETIQESPSNSSQNSVLIGATEWDNFSPRWHNNDKAAAATAAAGDQQANNYHRRGMMNVHDDEEQSTGTGTSTTTSSKYYIGETFDNYNNIKEEGEEKQNYTTDNYNYSDDSNNNNNNKKSNYWNDDEMNVWYNKNTNIVKQYKIKNKKHKSNNSTASGSVINTTTTDNQYNRDKKLSRNTMILQQRQSHQPQQHQKDGMKNHYKSNQNKMDLNHIQSPSSSIYWNEEFRLRWIHDSNNAKTYNNDDNTTNITAINKQSKVSSDNYIIYNNNNNNDNSNSNRMAFLDEFSHITPKKPSSIKLGKHFTFSFEEVSTQNISSNESYSNQYQYDHDDDLSSLDSISHATNTTTTTNNNSHEQHSHLNSQSEAQQVQQQHLPNNNTHDDEKDKHHFIKHYNEKSHWMPDQLCKHCYACEEKFTVFRRRHHCRLCGQVFCSSCSSHFVEIIENHSTMIGVGGGSIAGGGSISEGMNVNGNIKEGGKDHVLNMNDLDATNTAISGLKKEGQSGNMKSNVMSYEQNAIKTVSIRTCTLCYDQVSSSGPNGLIWDGKKMEKQKGNEGLGNLGGIVDETTQAGKINKNHVGFQGGSTHEGDYKNLALVKEKLEMNRIKESQTEQKEEEMKKEDENPVELIKNISTTLTRRFGRLAESAAREVQQGENGFNDEEARLIGTGVKLLNDDEEENESKGKSTIDKKFKPPSIQREVSDAVTVKSLLDEEKELKEINRKMGILAANHLEQLGKELLRTEASILIKEKKMDAKEGDKQFQKWVNTLMMLATRCCSTVSPDVRNEDLLDIRPYCKIKVIPGGKLSDSAFVSGVVFHKNVSHKSMTKEILNPRIMLLANGIEYTRTENRILTLDTLLEQEARYFQILVTKITKMKPDILMVGRSVSRKAQELLMETNIVLIQHVKPSLLQRVARQTGATILSSTENVMNRFDNSVLGKCRRFRLVSFRDDDIWNNRTDSTSIGLRHKKRNDAETIRSFIENYNNQENVDNQMTSSGLLNHQRQAVLAAGQLGDTVHDGSAAVKCGIAKRGVTVTFCMIEGCPSHLGCSVVLRGASRPALKQVKHLFSYLVNAAYNLKLETNYLRTRRVKVPENYNLPSDVMSSSLCVQYGSPPQGRKVRPWNGGAKGFFKYHKSLSGKITALDHQSILIASVWMAGQSQCCPAEVKGILYYSKQDVSLGQFLRDSCFNLTLKCQNPTCKKSVLEHSLSFIHNDGLINITVEEMDEAIPHPTQKGRTRNDGDDNESSASYADSPIATWTYCVNCKKVVTPLSFLSEDTWKFSFGKFLEVFFYNKTMQLHSLEHQCSCNMQESSMLYFGSGRLAARFVYEKIRPRGVYLRRHLPFDNSFHKKFTVLELNEIMIASAELFDKFHKQIEQTSKETRQLFGSPANKPEYLQTLLSQLIEIDNEVVRASSILKDKIVSVTNQFNALNEGKVKNKSERNVSIQETYSYFPWHSRRYLFMLASAWNERLSSMGQALSAMKKLTEATLKTGSVVRSDIGIVQNTIPESEIEDVKDAMKRLKQLREYYSDNLNIGDINTSSQSGYMNQIDKPSADQTDDIEYQDDFVSETVDREIIDYNFSEEVDADVLASRQRYNQHGDSQQKKSGRRSPSNQPKLPRRRSSSHGRPQRDSSHSSSIRSRSQSPSQLNKSKSVTAGGAVKSALTRLFNRASKEHDPYVVDLGSLGLGRPKMEAGVGGVVIPVIDDQPSTIIAHSLASIDYASQFKRYAKAEMKVNERRSRNDRDGASIDDYFTTSNSMDTSTHSNGALSPSSQSNTRSSQRNGTSGPTSGVEFKKGVEKRMLGRNKTHIKHTFRDYDEKDTHIAKFVCTTFWATQFQAVRQAFLKESSSGSNQTISYNNSTFGTNLIEKNYVKSLSVSLDWAVSGGKSGASFSKTADERFIVKCISRTELQMFLDCAPAYFEYLSKAFFHGLPSMLAKIVGVYQIGYHNRVTGKRTMEQVAVMQNIFYGRNISRVFDLKGKVRGRYAKQNLNQNSDKRKAQSIQKKKKRSVTFGSDTDDSSDDEIDLPSSYRDSDEEEGVTFATGPDEASSGDIDQSISTFLDGDFLEFTGGRPLPLTDRAKATFHFSILNDTLFLSIINVLDYSILVGLDEEKNELVVGIIDYMRQYDILKQMERVGKSIPMVVGSEAPTIIQPPLYKTRFINAMERYFMTVPSKWTAI